MIFHIGIDPWYNGHVTVYNEISKDTSLFKIDEIKQDDIDKVDIIFKEIKAKIDGEIGCTCIYLEGNFTNDIRKKIIENGKQYGFSKIQIINANTSNYIECCFFTKCKPIHGDIIWILSVGSNCAIWEKKAKKAKALWSHSTNPISTKDDLLKIKNDSKIDKNPNIIIYVKSSYSNLNSSVVKNAFPNCKLLAYDNDQITITKVALLKAQIMASDLDVLEYDTIQQLLTVMTVKINDKKFMDISWGEELPLEKTVLLPILNQKSIKLIALYKYNDKKFDFFYKEIKVTYEMLEAGEIFLNFKVDENLICTTNFEINESKQIKQLEWLYSNDVQKLYNIEQNISINNAEVNALGIDLGTSRCCAAVNRRNGIETIALDNIGEKLLPSYVSFNEEKEKCGQIVVDHLQYYSKSTVYDSKRIIGRKYEDIEIDKNWPFEIIDVNTKPILKLQGNHENFKKHPEEISAALLKHIKQKAEAFQGKELTEVVITVPAAFNEKQKAAMHMAGKFAGWETVHLLAEPIAASIAYFVDRPIPANFTMILFDFGGGTLDVCVFKIVNNILQIASQFGDNDLGGRDFDNLLFDHFSNILENVYDINVNSNDKFKYRLMQKSAAIKHALSTQTEAILDVNDFDTNNVKDVIKITRLEFEKMSSNLLTKTRDVVIKALSMANFISKDIHKVLFAGGSSRMPMIQKLLKEMFNKAEHCCEENPDEVVAIGAAHYAYYLQVENLRKNSEMEKDKERKTKNEKTDNQKKQDCLVI